MVHMVQCDKPAAASEGTPVSSQWQRAGTLGLLTLCYTLGELGHFLIATTSKQVANSLQFGDLRCYVDHNVRLSNVTNVVCMGVKTQVSILHIDLTFDQVTAHLAFFAGWVRGCGRLCLVLLRPGLAVPGAGGAGLHRDVHHLRGYHGLPR